jgi:hypothetical protein
MAGTSSNEADMTYTALEHGEREKPPCILSPFEEQDETANYTPHKTQDAGFQSKP